MKPAIAIPATLALIYRAYSRKSLTPLGILTAALTAAIHAAHPSPAPFAFLVVFFLAGTTATKVKHDVKATLTVSALGGSTTSGTGGEGPRTHVQVLANSGVASVLIGLQVSKMWWKGGQDVGDGNCFGYGKAGGLLMIGIVANYAVVAADTLSSELGILSKSSPRLITSLRLRKVPRGTNGGVTLAGLGAGALGAFLIALTSVLLLPFCSPDSGSAKDQAWTWERKTYWVLAVTIWGTMGSLLDSILGGLLQATVVDKRTGKVVEGSGGHKVLVHPGSMTTAGLGDVSVRKSSSLHRAEDIANTITPRRSRTEYNPLKSEPAPKEDHTPESRKIDSGHDFLDNNEINILMAVLMSLGGMAAASYLWDVSLIDGIL